MLFTYVVSLGLIEIIAIILEISDVFACGLFFKKNFQTKNSHSIKFTILKPVAALNVIADCAYEVKL